MKIELLLSCMHQFDFSIVEKSNIKSDTLIINQCDKDSIIKRSNFYNNEVSFEALMINTIQKGLSKSRNMAISHAQGDICIIADDDESFVENYYDIIKNAYNENPSADLIAFSVVREGKSYPKKSFQINYLHALRISSVQITFRRESIINKSINFDETMGAGSGNGGGEENKFLFDCIRKGLQIYYCPKVIAIVNSSNSVWYEGFNEKYFLDKGWAFKKIMGGFLGFLNIIRFVIMKYPFYKKEIGLSTALINGIRGVFLKRL